MTIEIRLPNHGLKLGDPIIETNGEVLALVSEVIDKDTVVLATDGNIVTAKEVGLELMLSEFIYIDPKKAADRESEVEDWFAKLIGDDNKDESDGSWVHHRKLKLD